MRLASRRRLADNRGMTNGFWKPAVALLLASLLAACETAPTDPYFAAPKRGEVRRVPAGQRIEVSVCYSSATTSSERLRQLVAEHCTDARPVAHGYDLDTCSLLAPVRATYSCSRISNWLETARPLMPSDPLR